MGSQSETNRGLESTVTESLALDGIRVDFSNPAQVRDSMEQAAASINCKTPQEKKEVSEYLEAIQKPNLKPDDLMLSTNRLLSAFNHGTPLARPDDSGLAHLEDLKYGIAVHYDLAGGLYSTTKFGEKAGVAMDRAGGAIENSIEAVAKFFRSAPPAPK